MLVDIPYIVKSLNHGSFSEPAGTKTYRLT